MSKYRAFKKLRQYVDSNDPFMTGGHQVLKVRKIERTTPEWAENDEEIKKFILRSFPKMGDSGTRRKRAARWARVINLYFRMHMTQGQITEELNLSLYTVKSLIRAIKRAAGGYKANGEGVYKNRSEGRPRKTSASIETPMGE